MVETFRPIPLDMKVVFKTLVDGIKEYTNKNHISVVVLGLSGGIDSTVVAALCKAGNVPVIGVSLPCSTNKADENDSALAAGNEFCDTFKVVNLQTPFETVEKFCTDRKSVV